ncbi:hypothetical protein J0695_17975 [Streptomyces beijiangensis]|uniref:Lipoprotein n=1 Tax=Streptomyces beijiangensis TaxID=163361 RepID=A0A939JF20_9ACTN|nr:hypothetical protein [Streptomyces beijiangensis]
MVALGAAALVLASGCASPAPRPDSTGQDIQAVLDRRAAAVVDRDESAYLTAVEPQATAERAVEQREFRNLAEIPLGSWGYRVKSVRHTGARATAEVELRYRIKGYDLSPVVSARTLKLAEHGGRWYIATDRPGKGAGRLLWQQGKVTAVAGGHSLVLGVGQRARLLREVAAVADRAVPAVDSAWQEKWSGRVVVLMPSSLEAMASLLGAPAASYRGIAAVTTGEAGSSGSAPADRVIINPQAFAVLGEFGQRVVVTHETTHVATRTHTTAATPLWLSEGFADWVAYRGSGRTAPQAAPELQSAVRSGSLPATLPTDEDFGFGGDADKLARAYEGGWLACKLIAQKWGEAKLTAFYRAVGAHKTRDGAVEKAMNDVLGTTPEDFAARWREYLRDQLG